VNQWSIIRNLAREGYSKKAISRMLGISRNTVRKALSSDEPPQYNRQDKIDILIAPYKEQIDLMYIEKELIGCFCDRHLSGINLLYISYLHIPVEVFCHIHTS